MIAVCVGTGVGFNALLARRLGEDRPDEANRVGQRLLRLSGLLGGLSGPGGGPGSCLYGALRPRAAPGDRLRHPILSIVTGASVGICMQFAGERTLQATGNTVGPMVIQGIGAVINLILDPLLIFGIGPFPGWRWLALPWPPCWARWWAWWWGVYGAAQLHRAPLLPGLPARTAPSSAPCFV